MMCFKLSLPQRFASPIFSSIALLKSLLDVT